MIFCFLPASLGREKLIPKATDLWWTCTRLCVCIQTQNWARLPQHWILQRKNLSLLQSPLLLTKSSWKDIQPIWQSRNYPAFHLKKWVWTIEFGSGAQAFETVSFVLEPSFIFKNKSGGVWVVGDGRSLSGHYSRETAPPFYKHHALVGWLQHCRCSQAFYLHFI